MKNQRSRRRRTPAGFSLLEMVIVLGIIAVILGGAIAVLGKVGEGAKLTVVDGDFNSIGSALKMYRINAGGYPTTQQGLEALVNKPTTTPVPKRWTRLADEIPSDPWNQAYEYKFPGSKDPTMYELVSKGPDGQLGTEDDISSQN